MTTDIYIAISRKCPRPGKGTYIAVLEAVGASGKAGTLTIRGTFDDITPHRLELRAIVDALHRFKYGCTINIHSEHGWFKTIKERGWFEKWQQAGWIVNGKPAAGSEMLQEIHMLETVCNMEFGILDKDLGSYNTWLNSEIEKYRSHSANMRN